MCPLPLALYTVYDVCIYIYIHRNIFSCSLAHCYHFGSSPSLRFPNGLRSRGFPAAATMPSAIISLVTSRLHYLRMKVEGPLQKSIDEVAPEAVSAIVACVGKVPKISIEDGSALQSLLKESVLTEAAQKTILEAVDAKVMQRNQSNDERDSKRSILICIQPLQLKTLSS